MKTIRLIIVIALTYFQVIETTCSQNQVLIPDTLSGTSFTLTLQNGTHPFFSGQTTTTMGVNGNILGPTLIMDKGDFVNITVNNNLNDTTTIHWHGMHVSAENDGGPHTAIAPSGTWNPSFTVMDRAATYWYHPHLHEKTNEHVSKGIAGFIIVRDNVEAALNLPRTYGVDDFPLAIQTKDFDASNQIVVPSNSDDIVMVNATMNAYLNAPAQVVRLRLLNGSSQRVFNLGFTNNQTFYQIASDGGLLSNPNAITRLLLAPGERAEVLVDLSTLLGQTIYLKSFASELPSGIYGATNPGMMSMMSLTGYNPNALNGTNFDILQINVETATANPVTTIPTTLASVLPIPETSANITRTLTFSPQAMGMNQLNGMFLINNSSFDMGVINYSIPLNNTEIWTLINQSAIAHPFHIHDVQFFVLDRNGAAPPVSEQGRKDVILVKPQETVRFIAKFEDFANSTVPYMYHCHMLVHEDGGMMGQFRVVDNSVGIDIFEDNDRHLLLSPNPVTDDNFSLHSDGNILLYEIFNISGIKLQSKIFDKARTKVDINIKSLPAGMYFLKVAVDGQIHTKKLIKK